jgi:hypothetical protein
LLTILASVTGGLGMSRLPMKYEKRVDLHERKAAEHARKRAISSSVGWLYVAFLTLAAWFIFQRLA